MNGQWPIQDLLEFGALVGAVPCARLHARQVLWEWGLGSLGDSTELVVAELVTNAVKASREMIQVSPVRLLLATDAVQVLILVWDASPRPPVRMDISGEAENGRGLMLVEAISEQWGWYHREDNGGKFVWAVIQALLPQGHLLCVTVLLVILAQMHQRVPCSRFPVREASSQSRCPATE